MINITSTLIKKKIKHVNYFTFPMHKVCSFGRKDLKLGLEKSDGDNSTENYNGGSESSKDELPIVKELQQQPIKRGRGRPKGTGRGFSKSRIKQYLKKAIVKAKVIELADIFNASSSIKVPQIVIRAIRKRDISLIAANTDSHKKCFEFFQHNSKIDIISSLFRIPKSEDELNFVRDIVLSEFYINFLFVNMNIDDIK